MNRLNGVLLQFEHIFSHITATALSFSPFSPALCVPSVSDTRHNNK